MPKHAFAIGFSASKIDAEKGIIYGVSLCTVGPARGHGVMVDMTTITQMMDCAAHYQGGLKVKLTHQGEVGDIVGSIRDLRIDGQQLRGDLHLLSTYDQRDYILEMAQEIPDAFGLSVAFSGPTEEVDGMPYARCTEIYSCDLVSEPAANPGGLFSAGVDAGREGNRPMTPEEIKTHVQAAVSAALIEFGVRMKSIEDKVNAFAAPSAFTALKDQVTDISAKLESARTDFNAKILDETKRIELAAKTVAQEFTRFTGTRQVHADGGGTGGSGSGGGAQPAPADRFVAAVQKHFSATKSQAKALQMAIAEDREGYTAFRSSGKNIKYAA